MDSQIIALLKDYWPRVGGVIAALAFWIHYKIADLLNDDEEELSSSVWGNITRASAPEIRMPDPRSNRDPGAPGPLARAQAARPRREA